MHRTPAHGSAHSLRRALAAAAAALFLAVAAPAGAKPAPESFADLSEKVVPAVVNISTTQTLKREDRPDMPTPAPGSPEELFKDFFDRQRPNIAPKRAMSLGSGFIVGPEGYIVTNHHVIKDADEIVVRMHDDRQFDAEIIGRDTKTDLALLKVKSDKPLPFLEMGDSDTLRVGDWVIAIGNPFGLGGTVTAGIISARQRDINSGPYDDFIQTDASINRGNSGGPLVGLDGRVVGIATAIFSPSGGSVGIGFAVPSSLAGPVIEQLREFGETKRGWLGVRIQTVTDEIADSLGLKEQRGALVASITPGGPAEKAGVQPGDVILSFDGKRVDRMRRLPRIVAESRIGKETTVEVWRKGKEISLPLTVGELKETEAAAAAAVSEETPQAEKQAIPGLGLSLSVITPALRSQYSLDEDVEGLVVTAVDDGGPADEKGVQEGDVLVEVNQDAVEDPAQVIEKVEASRKDGRRSVLLLVDRKGDLRFIAVGITKN
ncbi:serine protease Do [Constrictibacter sp. MBR-5]|jgi:serine protease Do|uniref:DegQ family serine endoprotease n=1 Tax=Constrictibacter sp. MBR-5 TaxID=3156467 RepID=UPI003392C837